MQVVLTEEEYNELKNDADFLNKAPLNLILGKICNRLENEHRILFNPGCEEVRARTKTLFTRAPMQKSIIEESDLTKFHYEITIKKVEDKPNEEKTTNDN